jgi:hypothetical protein
MQGLSVSRVVDVEVVFAPVAAPAQRFDTLLIMGDSPVIDTGEALREYNQIAEVAGDFGTTAPEYYGAALFFSQIPQPSTLFIGRYARTPTKARLLGGPLAGTEQLLAHWTSIANGGFTIAVDGGAATQVTGISLSSVTNLNGVASAIQTAIRAGGAAFTNASFIWNGQAFQLESGTTGTTSAVSFLSAPSGGGQDLSAQLKMTSALAERNAPGAASETPVASLARVDGRGWYAATFCASTMPSDAELLACCGYIEATGDKHTFGITTPAAIALDPLNTSDIASQAQLANFIRTTIQYSLSPYAICDFFGRALTTDFNGSNTTITMKFKVEPGVLPELLSASQASTLANKRCNVYVRYNNGTAIVQEGVMSGRAYFDEVHGLDWLSNRIQNDVWNVLYQSPKIPQTDPGVHILVATCDGGLSQGVQNGLVAPGTWNAPGFGELKTGDLLSNGWYTFANPIASQAQADRESRIAPLIQIAVKLAGAIHFADVVINVNR